MPALLAGRDNSHYSQFRQQAAQRRFVRVPFVTAAVDGVSLAVNN